MNRRAYLAGAGTVLAATTAGCGFILGNEPATFSASPSAVSESARQETGYEFVERTERDIEREFSVGGQSRRVVVTNIEAKYEKSVDLGPLGQQRAAVFTSLTTPQVNVLGEEFNPVEDMSAQELAAMAQDQYEGFQNVQQQNESDVTIDGRTTTQAKFSAQATLAGSTVDIFLHVSEAVELDEDFVVTFGGYPQQMSDERTAILRLMEAVESA